MKAKQKAEAIERMKMLGIVYGAIKAYEKHDIVMRSERKTDITSSLNFLTAQEEQMVSEFEEKHDAIVYMVVQTQTDFGLHKALLYVSAYDEEWEMDREDINQNRVMVYVVNCDRPDCSEFGSIGIKNIGVGLVRTW